MSSEAANAKKNIVQPAGIDRTVLPISELKHTPTAELDVRKAKAPPRFEIKAPEGAPNVVIVLIDDMGFGTASTFGGPVTMSTLDRLAQGGLHYNNIISSYPLPANLLLSAYSVS